MATTYRWFSGDAIPGERQQRFVETVAAIARTWDAEDLSPNDTSTRGVYDEGSTQMIEILIPLLTTPCRILRVLYTPNPPGCPELRGDWTASDYDECDDPYCEGLDEEADLCVVGVDASPEQCGRWEADWFERQLHRPVVRREWDRPTRGLSTLIPTQSTGPAYIEWHAANPDQYLSSRNDLRWGWLERRPPSREIWERAGSAHAEQQ